MRFIIGVSKGDWYMRPAKDELELTFTQMLFQDLLSTPSYWLYTRILSFEAPGWPEAHEVFKWCVGLPAWPQALRLRMLGWEQVKLLANL